MTIPGVASEVPRERTKAGEKKDRKKVARLPKPDPIAAGLDDRAPLAEDQPEPEAKPGEDTDSRAKPDALALRKQSGGV
eukprot:g7958.t1